MDTSKEYIKMCDCSEIQDNWKLSWSGLYYDKIENKIDLMDNAQPFSIDIIEYIRSQSIWLPRQDELQEIIKTPELEDPFCMCIAFKRFWSETPDIGYMSMEQLWLAFVMREKYNKIWDNENWVKDE